MVSLFLALLLATSTVHAKDASIKVMVIDSGIDAKNKNLAPYLDQSDVKVHFLDYKDISKIGHGTHIAGIVMKGICHEVKLYSCTYYSEVAKGTENMEMEIACIKRAKAMGVHLVNFSGGGRTPNKDEFDAVKDLVGTGAYLIVAAGNRARTKPEYEPPLSITPVSEEQVKYYKIMESCQKITFYMMNSQLCEFNSKNITRKEAESIRDNYYPAGYNFDEVVAIGSKSANGNISEFSNVGSIGYENGEDVWSLFPGNKWGPLSGTSQSTAIRTNKILKELCKSRGYK